MLELVEGPTLADRIRLGPIPVNEAIPIARQIAEALEAAHEQGIVHRDLKPANVKLRPDGTVKVLDFGLAKSLEPVVGRSGDVAASPTITSPAMTAMGIILGTAAYMSPEQAKGQAADKRSDVWAFGAVLYEMLSGRRAFRGDDVSDTLALVLKGEPDWSALPPDDSALGANAAEALPDERSPRAPGRHVRRPLHPFGRRRTGRACPTPTCAAAAAVAPPRRSRSLRPSSPARLTAVDGLARHSSHPSACHPLRTAANRTRVAASSTSNLATSRSHPKEAHIVYKGTAASGATGTQLFVRALDTLEPTPLTVTRCTACSLRLAGWEMDRFCRAWSGHPQESRHHRRSVRAPCGSGWCKSWPDLGRGRQQSSSQRRRRRRACSACHRTGASQSS